MALKLLYTIQDVDIWTLSFLVEDKSFATVDSSNVQLMFTDVSN